MRKSVWGVMSVRIMLSFGPCFAWNSPLIPPTFWHEIEIEGMEGGGRGRGWLGIGGEGGVGRGVVGGVATSLLGYAWGRGGVNIVR